jgi:hypothetical protein
MSSPSLATMLREHVSLSTACVDRLYLNGYVPTLQTPGQLTTSYATTSASRCRRPR